MMILATNGAVSWRMTFERDELDLRVEKIHQSSPTEPDKWTSLEGFLAKTPKDALQQEALDRLCDLLEEITRQ